MKYDIRDSRHFYLGWFEDSDRETKYYGVTKGYIGRYDKLTKRWYWTQGPRVGQLGPMGDIGYGEVLAAEGGK